MSVVFMILQSTALICCLSDRPIIWTVSVQNTVYTALEILVTSYFLNYFFNIRPVVFIIQVLKIILHKFILFFKKNLFKHSHAENKCIEIYC